MPTIAGYASVAGKKESEGPLGKMFDKVIFDSRAGTETYEEAESVHQKEAALMAMQKSGLCAADFDCIFAGDLLNQCVGSSFGLKGYDIPFLGQYGACSTMAQALTMAARRASLSAIGKQSRETAIRPSLTSGMLVIMLQVLLDVDIITAQTDVRALFRFF